jgi:hypothetical protein
MNHRQWEDRGRYGTSYSEWVIGNFLYAGLYASVITGGVGIVGTGMRALQGEHMFDKLNYGDDYTDWSEVAVSGIALSGLMLALCAYYTHDQRSRLSRLGIVMPRE